MLRDRTAFLFAGQGAQVEGMGLEFSSNEEVKELFKMAESLRPGILDIMAKGPKEALNDTLNTQPCMYLASLASAIVRGQYYPPQAVLGFSVGEIPALSYAGAFSYEDGFKIILERARLMSEATKTSSGAMVACMGLDEDAIKRIAATLPCAYPANFNSFDQIVVAVSVDSVEPLRAAVLSAGGKSIKLNVSGAFHCPMMSEASDKFKDFLGNFKISAPKIPVYANLTAQPYTADVINTLASQMQKPVLFYKSIINMIAEGGITDFEEQGPGSVLTKLVAKIKSQQIINV